VESERDALRTRRWPGRRKDVDCWISRVEVPIVGRDAGGPSTPELAAAVSDAGGLGFLGAGTRRGGVAVDIADAKR